MIRNKIFEILNTFSRKEMTRFSEFVHSPYHNKHQGVQDLVAYLSEIYPNFRESNCERALLIQHLFQHRPKQQQHLAVVFTYTQRLLEQFLVQEQFKIIDRFHNVLLLRNLRHRKLSKYYEKVMKIQENLLASDPLKNRDFFNLKYLTAEESDVYYSEQARHETDLSIQLKQNNLDNYYLTEKLKDACEMQNRGSILKVDYSDRLLKILIDAVHDNLETYQSVPPIMIYYHIYQMITLETEQHYYKALKVVESNEQFVTRNEQQNIYNFLQNYCIKEINKGNQQAHRLLFELIQKQLDKGLLLNESGLLSQWHYKNIVTNAIRLEEMEWTKSFIETYRHKLRPEVAENAYTFNIASYYYSSNELEKVQKLLIRVEYKDIRYSLAAKSLLMRTYYDLNEHEALLSLIRSFREYLRRNKLITDKRRRAFINLLNFTQRVFQIKSKLNYQSKQKSKKAFLQLQENIDQTNLLINEGWLKTKVKELEKILMI